MQRVRHRRIIELAVRGDGGDGGDEKGTGGRSRRSSVRDGRCCRRRVALRAPRRNFHVEAANRLDAGQLRPCRTADSIFSAPPALFAAPLPLSSHCLFSSFSLPRLEFERIIIRGTRAHGLSSREFLGVLSSSLSPDPFRASPSAPLPDRLSHSSLRFANTRKKPRLTGLLHNLTPYWRSRGTLLPYDFHVSASGPPKLHDRALY